MGTSGCTSPCGDGLKLLDEECDDGNTTSGDGCCADCMLEPGWDCQDVGDADDGHLRVPVVFRDFMSRNAPGGHPNFEPRGRRPGGDRDGAADAGPGPQAADDGSPARERGAHDGGRLRPVVPRLAARQDRARHAGPRPAAERHVRLRPLGDLEPPVRPACGSTPPFFPLDDRGWAEPPNGPEISPSRAATTTR